MAIRLGQVWRYWIVNQRVDTDLMEIALEGVTSRVPHHQDMPNGPGPFRHKGQDQLWNVYQAFQVMPRDHSAALIPCFKMPELDTQECGLQWIEPRVKALDFIVIFHP